MIYFNSDYLEGAHPALLEKLNETNMVQTVGYGEDEYCAAAREKIKAACQAPEADVHFLVGGTQTNTTVIAAILRPWQGVLSAVSGHINCHEAGAIESTGHKVITLPTTNGKITAQQVRDYVEWHKHDESTEHIVQPGMEKFGVADACAIISSYTRPLEIPVVFGFPAGHEDPNLAIYLGRRVTVSVDEEGARMEFAPAD